MSEEEKRMQKLTEWFRLAVYDSVDIHGDIFEARLERHVAVLFKTLDDESESAYRKGVEDGKNEQMILDAAHMSNLEQDNLSKNLERYRKGVEDCLNELPDGWVQERSESTSPLDTEILKSSIRERLLGPGTGPETILWVSKK